MAPGAPPVVLASGSPTRRALLAAAGVRFTWQAVDADEAGLKQSMRAAGAGAEQVALALAAAKASLVPQAGQLVIGADQLLVCDGTWFDKPTDLPDARRHLEALRGRTHTLVTAVLCQTGGRTVWQHVATPRLTMRPFSDAFLQAYLTHEGDAVLGCVGAYRLEAAGAQLFDQVEGEHAAVLGLPLLPLLAFLRDAGALLG